MIKKLKLFFTPPIFDEPDKTLKARSSFFLAIVGSITSIFAFIFYLLFASDNIFRLLIIGFSIFFSLLPLVFLRMGYVRATIIFQAGIIWFSVVVTSFSTGGVRSIGFVGGTIASLLVMGIALEPVSILVFIFFSILAAGTLAWMEGNGLIDPSTVFEKPVIIVVTYASYLSVLTGILYLTYRNIAQALAQARKEIAERERVEGEREEIIHELENEIKERHRLQEEREHYIEDLSNKNAELERFTYTVSHELRNPLVTITGFLSMLEKDIRDNKKERIQGDFHRISNATDKMQSLLTDLLELSRIGRIVTPSEEIHLTQVVHEALITIEGRLAAGNIKVEVSDLPTIYADRVRMREVMQNLLENAVKYMGDQATPIIHIGVRDQGGERVLYVKDNGVGIDPKYHTRIFNLFEQLNPGIEGTGIGLPIVKRIIELHGGRIWVESEGLGKGSTFCFTIPDSRQQIM